jgi:hypothetical protein
MQVPYDVRRATQAVIRPLGREFDDLKPDAVPPSELS